MARTALFLMLLHDESCGSKESHRVVLVALDPPILFLTPLCGNCTSVLYVVQAIRIAVMQTTTAVTHYYNDQLKVDMEREDRISSGEITRAQAEKEDEAWQEVSCTLVFGSILWCCSCSCSERVLLMAE